MQVTYNVQYIQPCICTSLCLHCMCTCVQCKAHPFLSSPFHCQISPLRLTRSRLPYASLSPNTAGLVGGGAVGVRYVENCSSSCPPRRQGEHCGSCTKGYTVDPAYGGEFARCVPCYCSFKSPVCDPMSGVCSSCVNHTDGDFCQNCSPGYTREHWYEQCNQCDGGYWEEDKGVCAGEWRREGEEDVRADVVLRTFVNVYSMYSLHM